MIEITINPLFYIGSLEIRWIFLTTALSFIVVIIMGIVEAKRSNYTLAHTVGLSLSFIAGSIIGGKLFYILDNWQSLLHEPIHVILSPWVVMYGVIIGGLAGITTYTTIKKIAFWQIGDIIAPGAMLGLAVYRVGCIINGCCYGLPAHLPWAVVYTNPDSVAPFGKLLHPTQTYHFLLSLLAFAVLWMLRKKMKQEGSLFLLWLVLLAATDLPVRLFREGEPFLFGLQQAQFLGIVTLVIAVPWLIIKIRSYYTKTKVSK